MLDSVIYRQTTQCLTPPVDIYEAKDKVIITAELPGVPRDQLKIEVIEQELTIQGRVPRSGRGVYLIHESTQCDYYRAFRLAQNIDTSNIEATLSEGVLTITLPKRETSVTYEVPIETE